MIFAKEEYGKKIDKSVFPGVQGGPLMHVIAAKAVSFKEVLSPEFKTYTAQIIKNAQALSKALTDEGIRIVSGGTDNHLVLLDRKSTRLNSSHVAISYAVFCLQQK